MWFPFLPFSIKLYNLLQKFSGTNMVEYCRCPINCMSCHLSTLSKSLISASRVLLSFQSPPQNPELLWVWRLSYFKEHPEEQVPIFKCHWFLLLPLLWCYKLLLNIKLQPSLGSGVNFRALILFFLKRLFGLYVFSPLHSFLHSFKGQLTGATLVRPLKVKLFLTLF